MNGSNQTGANHNGNIELDMPMYLLDGITAEQADIWEKKFGIVTLRDLAHNQWFNTAFKLTGESLELLGELKMSVLRELAQDGFQNFNLETFRSLPLDVFRHLPQKEIEILNAFGIQSVGNLSDSLFSRVARSYSSLSFLLTYFVADSSPDVLFFEGMNEEELAKINVSAFEGITPEEMREMTIDMAFRHLTQEQLDVLYERFGVLTIGDLTNVDLILTIEELNFIFELPLHGLHGIAPEDLAMTADEVKMLPVGVLKGLTQEQIILLRDKFGIVTLQDMAHYDYFSKALWNTLLF
jgi:hypothetical protein